MNRFGRALFRHFTIDPSRPEASEFIGSHTSMLRKNLSLPAARRLARTLGIDAESFVANVSDAAVEADHVFVLRHTLMNPWLSGDADRGNFIGRYCDFLERAIAQTLASTW
jgi:hypothetical protein